MALLLMNNAQKLVVKMSINLLCHKKSAACVIHIIIGASPVAFVPS